MLCPLALCSKKRLLVAPEAGELGSCPVHHPEDFSNLKSGFVRVMESCLSVIAESKSPIDALLKGHAYRVHKIRLGTLTAAAFWVPR